MYLLLLLRLEPLIGDQFEQARVRQAHKAIAARQPNKLTQRTFLCCFCKLLEAELVRQVPRGKAVGGREALLNE